jgi:hypothetical protein
MATAITETFATPRSETHHYIGTVPIALCSRFVVIARQRYEQRRMLRTVQELDHAGVLADVEVACANQRD